VQLSAQTLGAAREQEDMPEERCLVVPSQITIEIEPSDAIPVVAGAIAGIRCFARKKNDYHLGPVFADASGVMHVMRAEIELLAAAQLETDLMGLAPLTSAFPFVELRLWRRSDIERAIEGRRRWGLVGEEPALYESVESLIEKYENSVSRNLDDVACPPRVRDEWLDEKPKTYRLPMF